MKTCRLSPQNHLCGHPLNHRTPPSKAKTLCAAFLLSGFLAVNTASAVDLSGTIFETAGKSYHVDPALLFSIALVESAVRVGESTGVDTLVTPSPWTLRTLRKPYYAPTREAAKVQLAALLKITKSVDIGLMQINSRWHGHRVKQLSDLLDPQTNVNVGAEILAELFKRHPNDAFAALGKYHSNSPQRGAWYARRVVTVYENISFAK